MSEQGHAEPPFKPLGGTDAAAIMGFSTNKSGFDVWCERVDPEGAKKSDERNERMEWGSILEPAVLGKYAERENARLVTSPCGTVFEAPAGRVMVPRDLTMGTALAEHSPLLPWWWGGHPDAYVLGYYPAPGSLIPIEKALLREQAHRDTLALIVPDPYVVVEAKCADSEEDWGEPYTDQVPIGYLVQGQWYAPLIGAGRIDWPVLFRGSRMLIYRADADAELRELMLNTVGEFVEKYLVTGNAPPVEFTERAARYVRNRYPLNRAPLRRAEAPEDVKTVNEWVARRDIRLLSEKEEGAAALKLQLLIGDAEGAEVPGGHTVTWKKAADSSSVNWEQVARWVAQQAGVVPESFREAVTTFTQKVPGSRRMHVKGKR